MNKLSPTETDPTPDEPLNQFVSELTPRTDLSRRFDDCDTENVQDWFECDEAVPGYGVMTS